MADTISVTENHEVMVVIGDRQETYNLNTALPEDSIIVSREKKDILHQMDLQTVITNLDNSVDLLDVSYHAVYGFKLQSQIFSLQKTLMDLNDKGILVINSFKTKAAMITQELAGIFRWLTKGMESVAIGKLEKFSQYASGMSQQAQNLADDYQKLADNTSSVLQATMDENAKQYGKREELSKMLNDFRSQQEAAQAAHDSIEKNLKELRRDYDRLIREEEQEQKQRNTMAIIGAVFSFLGSAVSIAGEVVASKSSGGFGSSGSSAASEEDKKKLAEDKQEKEKLDAQIKTLEEEIKDCEQKLKDKAAEKETADEARKKEIDEELTALRLDIREKKKQKEDLETKSRKVSESIERLAKLLSDIGGDIKEAEPSEALALERSKRMSQIYDQLIKLEEENTKQLGQLAEYTKKMETIVIDQHSTEAAIQALIIAISCLKRVVVAIKDIALFWNSMEECCRSLADSSLKDDIKSLQEIDKEERILAYYDVDIMYPILCYAAKWMAVYCISKEYIAAAEKTRFRLEDTIVNADSTEMSREDHWEKASELAGAVSNSLDMQIADSKKKIQEMGSHPGHKEAREC